MRVRKRSFSFAKLTFSSLSVRPLVASKIESNFRVGLNILCRSLPYHSNKRIALFTLSSFWSVAINSNVISINGAILSHCHLFVFLFGMLFILLLIFLGPRGPLIEPSSVHPSTHPPVRNNFSWVHRWAETVPSGLKDPSNCIFYESWWCQLSKFVRKFKYRDKYKDKYTDKYKDRDE